MKTTIPFFGQSSPPSPSNGEGSDPDILKRVDHPDHYTSHPSGIEAIAITAFESFCIGNCFKYLMRRKFKGDELGDLLKARWYLDKEIELVKRRQGS